MHQGISLILACTELEIEFQSSTIEYKQAATGFRAVSRNEIIKGSVGALDGWLCKIETPSASETREHFQVGIIMHRVSTSKRAVIVNAVLHMYQLTHLDLLTMSSLLPSLPFVNWWMACRTVSTLLLITPTSTRTSC
jgi:hypothetical protein